MQADWIRAIAEDRDKQAFRAVFDHYGPRLRAYLLRRGASESLADELVQEVLLIVWRQADYLGTCPAGRSSARKG